MRLKYTGKTERQYKGMQLKPGATIMVNAHDAEVLKNCHPGEFDDADGSKKTKKVMSAQTK